LGIIRGVCRFIRQVGELVETKPTLLLKLTTEPLQVNRVLTTWCAGSRYLIQMTHRNLLMATDRSSASACGVLSIRKDPPSRLTGGLSTCPVGEGQPHWLPTTGNFEGDTWFLSQYDTIFGTSPSYQPHSIRRTVTGEASSGF
jgi:hypothetical protein